MPASLPSSAATTVFLCTVGVVALLFVIVARRVRAGSISGMTLAVLVLLATLAGPAALARGGFLDQYNPMPAPALLIIAVILVGTVVLALSRFGGKLAANLSLEALIGFQAFRIAVEWVLHRLYTDGVVPVQMTFVGRNFDILTGATAVVLALVIATGRRPRGLVILWNLAGLGLLVNIIAIAVLSTPVPFRAFLNDPPNLLPSTYPFVWLPTFLVPAALFVHLLVFRAVGAREWR